jgi:hypothetical protein
MTWLRRLLIGGAVVLGVAVQVGAMRDIAYGAAHKPSLLLRW